MNIGFGKAAVALSGIANCRIMLNVPEIRFMHSREIPRTIHNESSLPHSCLAVEQTFTGSFSGSALLYLPDSHIAALISGYGTDESSMGEAAHQQLPENSTAMETGNIVIESCTGTLADLLDCHLAFHPPRLVDPETGPALISGGVEHEGSAGILCKTSYGFGQDEVPGFLFIALPGASLAWLRDALDKYLANLA